MSAQDPPPPPGARKGLVLAAGLIVVMALAVFIGFNLYHAKKTDTPMAPRGAVEAPPAQSRP